MRALLLSLSVCAALAGCEAGAPSTGARSESRAPGGDGMCKEHGVLEAVCTKCNPALIAVFRAKGDFCEEHGFPESFCPICHPERAGKPLAAVAADDAPPDGTKVRLKTKDTAATAGIKTEKAEAREGGARITASATILFDATRRAEINARTPGVVRSLLADVGASVSEGTALATLESAAVGADRARIGATASRLKIAESSFAREKELADKGIASRKELLQAEQELEEARAEHAAMGSSLGMIGARSGALGRYVLASPIAGTVIRREVTIGEHVEEGRLAFEIADTSKMWAELDIAEADIALIATGQRVLLKIDALPERTFEGTVAFVAPSVDPKTRTVKARVPLDNPDGVLRANMFAEAEVELGATRASVIVPRSALQSAKHVRFVFIKRGDDLFELVRVKTGVEEAQRIEILRGVAAGDEIATEGSFLLKTETLKDSIGAGCCD